MNAKLLRFYQKKMHGGRSIIARSVDYIVFRLALAVGLFFLFIFLSHSLELSILVSLFLTVAVSLVLLIINKDKARKYIEKDFQRIKQICLLEELTFMSEDDFAGYLSRLFDGLDDIKTTPYGFMAKRAHETLIAFHNHPKTRVDLPDIVNILRDSYNPVVFVSLSDFSDDVKVLSKSMNERVTLIDGKAVLNMALQKDMLPDEKEAEQRAEHEMNEAMMTLEKIKNEALKKTKFKRYIICGIVVLLWSIVTGFRFYYPLIAGVCFLLALIAINQRGADKESKGTKLS